MSPAEAVEDVDGRAGPHAQHRVRPEQHVGARQPPKMRMLQERPAPAHGVGAGVGLPRVSGAGRARPLLAVEMVEAAPAPVDPFRVEQQAVEELHPEHRLGLEPIRPPKSPMDTRSLNPATSPPPPRAPARSTRAAAGKEKEDARLIASVTPARATVIQRTAAIRTAPPRKRSV